jgi:hypothetical protein
MLGVTSGVTLQRIRVGFGESAFILYRGSLHMIHAVTTLFGFRSRTENPRVGGSIPSLATSTKTEADKRLTRNSAQGPRASRLVTNGVTLRDSSARFDVKPAYERINLRGFVAAHRLLA